MRRQKLLEEEAERLRNEKENERQKDIKYFLETVSYCYRFYCPYDRIVIQEFHSCMLTVIR